jgi:asparagine synthase (glutamine-hydrolysing)
VCGIAGFSAPGPDAATVLSDMLTAIAHRGPDGTGSFVDRGIALGHRRLAIVDLAGGAQPRVDDASGDALTFNGEIYGYKALAESLRAEGVFLRDRSDTEVLFQMIRRYGVQATVERIDGMFAFAFRDGTSGRLSLARDRFGEKPLHFGVARDGIVFASEASAVLCHPAFRNAKPDLLAAYQLLSFEYVPGTESGWTGVHKLAPGTILTYEKGCATLDRYWRPSVGRSALLLGENSVIDHLDNLLQDAVRRQVVADVKLGVFLSGGIDSSLLTAMALKVVPDITAFTVRVGGDGFDETPHAIAAAKHIGVRHNIVTLSDGDMVQALDDIEAKLSEPIADSSLLPTWLVCRAAREHMTVALGGDGADELFAGYPNFAVQRYARLMARVPPMAGIGLARALNFVPSRGGYMNVRFLLSQLSQGFGAAPARQSYLWMAPFGPGRIDSIWAEGVLPDRIRAAAFAPIDQAAAECAGISDLNRLIHQFLVTYLPDDILMKTDRAAMFNSLEVRAPFLDRGFADYASGLPSSLKLQGGTKKYILKKLALRYLPPTLVERKKHGFAVPIGRLLRTLFRERCRDMVLSRANPVAHWFDRAALERMVQEHMSGRHDHGKALWSLHMLFSVAARGARA